MNSTPCHAWPRSPFDDVTGCDLLQFLAHNGISPEASVSWGLQGNAGTDPLTDFLGTTELEDFHIRTHNIQALKIQVGPTNGYDKIDLITGDTNTVLGAYQRGSGAALVGGWDNSIVCSDPTNYSGRCGIFAGSDNLISADNVTQCDVTTIVGCFTTTVTNSEITGLLNTEYSDVVNSYHPTIVGGYNHLINANADFGISVSAIFSGHDNEISTSTLLAYIEASAIIAGQDNTITEDVLNSVIVGGTSNNVGGFVSPTTDGGIFAGFNNDLDDSIASAIIGAHQGFINTSESCLIAGGYHGTIENSTYSTIVGGANNSIEGDRSVIVGGQRLSVSDSTFGFQTSAGSTVDITAFNSLAYFGNADLWLGNVDNTARKLKLFSPNTDFDYSSAKYLSLQAQAQAANVEIIFPATLPAPGDSLRVDTVVGSIVTFIWGP